jgi:hypothetical protein
MTYALADAEVEMIPFPKKNFTNIITVGKKTYC